MIKEFEDLKRMVNVWKKRKEDFFWQMEHYQISYFNCRIMIAYLIMVVCFLVADVMLLVCGFEKFTTPIIITFSVLIALMLAATLYCVYYLFLKNCLQFKLGKLSSGLKSFAMLIVPIYLILLICYLTIPHGLEVIRAIFTAVTSTSAAILAIMGVHYTLVQQKLERIQKNNLLFELYENSDSEFNLKIKNAQGELSLELKIKNISNNYGYLIGLYTLCGCDVYQVGNSLPYLAVQPNKYLLISDIKVNKGDDQIVLVYKDIGDNFYYLLLSIIDNKICNIEKAGKCDFEFLEQQIIETNETEKAVNIDNEETISSETNYTDLESIDIERRKEETKPNRTIYYNGFEVLVSKDGEIITDVDLLLVLKKERLNLAKAKKIKAYMIFNNQQLVALATFKPYDEISFISIYGLGKKKYDLYGEQFIKIITDFIKSNDSK